MSMEQFDRIVVSWADGRSQQLRLDPTRAQTIIGRASDAELQIEEPGLSRHHFTLRHADGAWRLFGAHQTTNATFLNGRQLLEDRALRSGDTLQVEHMPQLILRFWASADEPLLSAPPLHDERVLISPEDAAAHGLPCGLDAPRLEGLSFHKLAAPMEWLSFSAPPGSVCAASLRIGPTPLLREHVWELLWEQHIGDLYARELPQHGDIWAMGQHVEARAIILGQSHARRAVLLAPIPLPSHTALSIILRLELDARASDPRWSMLTDPRLSRLLRETRIVEEL
jgi:hypothetical protein